MHTALIPVGPLRRPRRHAPAFGVLALALALLLLPLAAGALHAQDAARTTPSADDLRALIYYFDHKDQKSADAELRRLQTAFPDWTPPTDLNRLKQVSPSTEIDTIYHQIATGDVVGARATLAETKKSYPSWTPPAEMISLLNLTEGQTRLDGALAAGHGDEALQIVADTPDLLRCDRVNNAWRIAGVQADRGDKAAALQTYGAVVDSCTSFHDVSATLEKADALATEPQLMALFATAEQRFPDRATSLQELRARLLAGRGKAPADPGAAASPAPPPKPAPVTPPATDRTASSRGAAADRSSRIRAAAAAGDWSRCVALSSGSHDPAIIYQRAWCTYNLDRPMEALAGFSLAEKAHRGGTIQRDARYGMALAYLKMYMTDDAARLAASTRLTRSQRVEVESTILDQRGVRAYKLKEYRAAVRYFNALEKISGGLRRDLAVLRAYAYLNAGDRGTALKQFKTLDDQLATDATRAGLAAAR